MPTTGETMSYKVGGGAGALEVTAGGHYAAQGSPFCLRARQRAGSLRGTSEGRKGTTEEPGFVAAVAGGPQEDEDDVVFEIP